MKRLKSEVCFVYHFLFNQIKLSVPKLLIYFQQKTLDKKFDLLYFSQIINAEVFKILKAIHGSSYEAFMMSKLVPVCGDVCSANLGIDADTTNEIAKEIDVIINSAAKTTWDTR